MYKDNDSRSEGHLCIRDMRIENEELIKKLDLKEQDNQSLETKITQLETNIKESDTLIKKICEDHDSAAQNQTQEKMGVLNKERQTL